MSINKYEEVNAKQLISERDPFSIERYLQFARYFKESDRFLLDVGCNRGMGGIVLKSLSEKYNITGIDVVKERIAKIPQGIYSMLQYGSIIDLDLPQNYFDVSMGGEFIEHINPEDVNICLKKLYDSLKLGGAIMLTTPNPKSVKVRLGNKSIFKDPSHVSIMTKESLQKKVQSIGFHDIRIIGSGKAIRLFGEKFPYFNVYGSYLLIATK